MKTGFTLIELLVVVLIIGILAAIALPQYQKAVERSRIAEAIQVLGDWANAQSIYYMQHNTFTEDINDGDITLPAPGNAFEYEIDDRNLNISAALSAIRASGIYEGGELMIRVSRDGSIEKICNEPRETTGFCPMAQAAGYLPEGNNSGGIGNLGGDAILDPIGPCTPGSSGGNCLSW